MPAPTYTITQVLPTCAANFGCGLGTGGNVAAGSVTVDSSCCRKYGTQFFVGVTTTNRKSLLYQGVDGSAQIYASDSFTICGSDSDFGGSHSGTGTISGSNFEGSGTGLLTGGGVSGGYYISIEGSFSSPGNGTFTGTVSGAMVGTVSGSIVAGVVTGVTYTITYPGNFTDVTGPTGSFTIDGGGTTFTFTGTINGSGPPPTLGYYRLAFSTCNAGGIVLEMYLDADDSLICEWSNVNYSLYIGAKTILNRTWFACDHPCLAIQTPVAQLSWGTVLCFSNCSPTIVLPWTN